MKLPSSVRALRYPNYRLYFGGQLTSLTGTWMQSVAQSWLVYRMTHSAFLLGLVGFAGTVPVFALGPVAGLVVDHFPKRRLILITQACALLQATIIAALTLTGVIQVWHVFALALMLGTINAFDIPARQSFIVEMVEREDMMNAIALNSSMVNGARIAGPALAGVLVAAVGEGWCFFVNAVSYVAVIGGFLRMKVKPHVRVVTSETVAERLAAGVRYARRTPTVRALLLLIGLTSLMGMPFSVLMPVFADAILHHGAGGLGLLMGASGLGSLAGALGLAARTGLGGIGRLIARSSIGFGIALFCFSWSTSFPLSVALLVPAGFFLMTQSAATNTLIQAMVPDALRGRVMALYTMMFLGMAPFGNLFAGFVAKHYGAPAAVRLGGIACLVGGLVFRSRLPRLRELTLPLLRERGLV